MTKVNKNMLIATVVLILLVVLGLWMLIELLKTPAPTPLDDPTVVASRDLSAYEPLAEADLRSTGKSDGPASTGTSSSGGGTSLVDKFKGRYLLTSVKKGQAVTDEMLAPSSLTETLGKSFVTALPATSATTIAGQLHVGDKIDMIAVPPKLPGQQTTPVTFEDVLVIGLPANGEGKPAGGDGVIVLAIPQVKPDTFASATNGATLVVTKKIKTGT